MREQARQFLAIGCSMRAFFSLCFVQLRRLILVSGLFLECIVYSGRNEVHFEEGLGRDLLQERFSPVREVWSNLRGCG